MKNVIVEAHTEEAWINAFKQIATTKNEDVQFELKCSIADITMPEDVNDKTKNSAHSPIIYLLRFVSTKKEDDVRFKLLLHLDDVINSEKYNSIVDVINKKVIEFEGGTVLSAQIEIWSKTNVQCSRIGWMDLFSKIKKKSWFSFFETKIHKIEIKCNSGLDLYIEEDSITDICDFRFYLPIRDYLEKKGVEVNISQEFSNKIKQRFKPFFALDDKKTYFGLETASDILPIVTIHNPYGDDKSKEMWENERSKWDDLILIYRNYITNAFSELAFSLQNSKNEARNKTWIDTYTLLYANSTDKYKLFLINAIELTDEYIQAKEILKKEKTINREDKKKKREEIEKAYDNQKEELIRKNKDLFSFKDDSFPDNDICLRLSCLIFAFMLRQYVSDMEAPLFTDDSINGYFLRQLLADSKSYAEGLWQLIENAHEHSQGKVAFFGMRLHKAGTNATVSRISQTAQTRSNLANKFVPSDYKKDSIFNTICNDGKRKYQDFLEFFVLDDTVDTPTSECKGILETIWKHQNGDIAVRPKRLCDIFDLNENSYKEEGREKFYIKHYGMRWLKHHVEKHDGIMMILSPSMHEDIGDVKEKEQVSCFYHNILDKKENNTERTKSEWILEQMDDLLKDDEDARICNYFKDIEEAAKDMMKNGNQSRAFYQLESLKGEVSKAKYEIINEEINRIENSGEMWLDELGKCILHREISLVNKLGKLLYFTEYDILLPISHDKQAQEIVSYTTTQNCNYYEKWTAKDYTTNYYCKSCIEEYLEVETLSNKTKYDLIKDIKEKLIKDFKRENGLEVFPPKGISAIIIWNFMWTKNDVSSDVCFSNTNVEICAKVLFLLIYSMYRTNTNSKNQLRISIDFGPKEYVQSAISEFIRIFSVFYLKSGKNNYMKNVQIAVCSQANDPNDHFWTEINFILAGENMKSAHETANKFVYYNAASSLEYVPLLTYLSGDKSSSGKSVPIYPYELINYDENKSWFTDYMKKLLMTEIGQNLRDGNNLADSFGCKISDVRVRLGSKIHIDGFYEAELLFHNIGNIRRFAYLVAKDIFAEKKTSKNKKDDVVYVLGYENYSAPVVQEVVRLLKEWNFAQNIFWAMDTHTSGTYPVMDLMERKEDIFSKEIKAYTIIPIGSTMSTVYKVQEAFKRGVKKAIHKNNATDEIIKTAEDKIKFCGNYVVVAVGDVFKGKKEDKVANDYVSVDPAPGNKTVWQTATIKPEKSGNGERSKVKYCLAANAEWHDPQNEVTEEAIKKGTTEKEGKPFFARPIIHVDKTSTIINTTFVSEKPTKEKIYYKRFSMDEVMKNRIDLLAPKEGSDGVLPLFRYGHIVRGANHYQFYFDFKAIAHNCLTHGNNCSLFDDDKTVKKLIAQERKIKEKEVEQEEIDKVLSIKGWVASQLAATIEKSAYNIVVSPLSDTNAEFCKTVLDNVFESNFHFIHVDVNETDKEDFRTRYGYIADELKRIYDANINVRFFFIDESVCTGKTLERASKLLGMLCNQSGVSINELRASQSGCPFDKVILLMNRSSYETAHQWVNDPVEDWVAFFDIAIPQYNMENGSCPGCKVRDRYDLLYKRSATNMLSEYFNDKVEKFDARTKVEYDQHLENELEEQKYLEWYKLYYDKNRNEKDNNGNEIPYDKKKMQAIIAKEQFIRFKTMDRAYRELFYNDEENGFISSKKSEFIGRIETKILVLLANALYDKQDLILMDSETSKEYVQFDCFISYLKVISRDYLAHIYDIRAAIYNILHCIFILLILPKNENLSAALKELKKKAQDPMTLYYIDQIEKKGNEKYCEIYGAIRNINDNKIDTRLQYRIFKTVVHRLAMLHSDYIVKPEVIKLVSRAYEQMIDDEPDQKYFNEQRVLTDYLASIKMASMAEDDDAMCVALKKTSDDLLR